MKLLFDFTVDKTTNTINITREFAADLDLVWDAFTKAEILDQWYAPAPWRVETKVMDFREGGRWHYAMVSPENTRGYSLVEFLKIDAKSSFTGRNSFSDEEGNSGKMGFTSSLTTTSFKENADITVVHISKKMASLEELEKFASLGFKEGTNMAFTNLDNLLADLLNRK